MVRLLLLCSLPLLSSARIAKAPPGLDATKYQVDGTDERVWSSCQRDVTVECTATERKTLEKDLCLAFSNRPIEKEVCHESWFRGPFAHTVCGKCNVAPHNMGFWWTYFCAKDGSSSAFVTYNDSECQQVKKKSENPDVDVIPFQKGEQPDGSCHSGDQWSHICDALCCHSGYRGRCNWVPVQNEAECNKSANCGYRKALTEIRVTQNFLQIADAKQDVVV
jgi:hypothetical protein